MPRIHLPTGACGLEAVPARLGSPAETSGWAEAAVAAADRRAAVGAVMPDLVCSEGAGAGEGEGEGGLLRG